jgi:hypothetical protein
MAYTLIVCEGDTFCVAHFHSEHDAKHAFNRACERGRTMVAVLYGPDGFINSYRDH